MLRRLTFRTSPRCKFQKKTSTSPSPKPNADSLPHRLPAEVIYRIIDRHLFVCHGRDLDTLKALALTCKSLRSHCLQYLFASIAIRKYPCACCGNPEGLENPSGQGRDALEFAGIVKQSPEIASVVRSLCIEALPRQRTRNILLNTGKSSDSAKAFTFIINRLTNLEDLEAEALQCKWEDIDTAVQAALTRTLQSDTLKTVSLSMIDIPAVVLSECTSVEWMTIRAAVWDDGRVLQDGRRLPRPRILELDSTCTDSVQPLLNALDLTAVTTLDLGTIDLYNAEYDRLVKACWASLTKLTFTAQGWLDQLEQRRSYTSLRMKHFLTIAQRHSQTVYSFAKYRYFKKSKSSSSRKTSPTPCFGLIRPSTPDTPQTVDPSATSISTVYLTNTRGRGIKSTGKPAR